MAKYKNIVITNSGLALIAAAHNGDTIQFTSLKSGNGVYSGTEILEDMTDLKSVKQTFGVSGITREEAVVKVRSVLTNEGVTEGYYLSELGVYVLDPSIGTEILYAVIVAENDMTDYFSPYAEFPQSITFEIYLAITGVNEGVTFTASVIEDTYATVQDLEEFRVEVDALKKSVSDGKTLVAGAITGKGVSTATDATFQTMAENIAAIETNPTLQAKTVTLGTAAQTIRADSGFDGLSQVTVPAVAGTAIATNVLKGKTFASAAGVNLTGAMVDNGAVSQALAINGSYTIPAGYHNGSGKITQSITTKGAATITPGDSAQTIAAGQYLSGVQTISAVPTETKTVTAGTSATTVNRTSGKYMTSVTVNPTPSQTKTVTLTSSPLTITPDAGKLLSSVTVSANLGKGYAAGVCNNSNSVVASDSYYTNSYSVDSTSYSSIMQNIVIVTHGLPFVPRIVRLRWISPNNNNEYVTFLERGCEIGYIRINNDFALGASYRILDYTTKALIRIPSLVTDTIFYFMPMAYGSLANVTWEAWE